MGQVTPWRYSSTGNESTERATMRVGSLLVSLPLSSTIVLFDPSPRKRFFDIHSDNTFPPTRVKFLPRVYTYNRPRSPDQCAMVMVDRVDCYLERFHDWTVREFEQGSRGAGWTEGGNSIEPSAWYRGMFLALLGIVAYRECIVCWSGR